MKKKETTKKNAKKMTQICQIVSFWVLAQALHAPFMTKEP
jgi:hypothetical protein